MNDLSPVSLCECAGEGLESKVTLRSITPCNISRIIFFNLALMRHMANNLSAVVVRASADIWFPTKDRPNLSSFFAKRHFTFQVTFSFYFFILRIRSIELTKKKQEITRHRFVLQQTRKKVSLQALPPSEFTAFHDRQQMLHVIYDMSNMTAVSWIALTTESESLSIITQLKLISIANLIARRITSQCLNDICILLTFHFLRQNSQHPSLAVMHHDTYAYIISLFEDSPTNISFEPALGMWYPFQISFGLADLYPLQSE